MVLKQAAESLCMNGRALNEKAIEVSPSSSRVLDRAAEILTPFPPSKNRPRPGDWMCPSCGFSNFQRRTACFRCSFPAMASGPPGDPAVMGYQGYGGMGYGPMGGMNVGHPGGGHMGGHHGMGGHGGGGGRGSGGIVPFRAGDWRCGNEGCSYHNFAKNVSCLRCGGPRSRAAVVADSAFPSPMDTPNSYGAPAGMLPGPPSMAGTPGPGPFAAPAGAFGSGAFGPPPGGFAGPGGPSSYALPSGLGYGSGPMMGAPYAPNGGMPPPPAGFDARAEAAFTSAGAGNASTGATFGNGAGGFGGADPGMMHGQATGGAPGQGQGPDPFAFLSSGLGALNMNDDRGRPGGAGQAKSPA